MKRFGWPAAALCAAILSAAPAFGQLGDQWYCANGTPEKAIAACTRLIESGKLQGRALAEIYNSRGATYSQLQLFRYLKDPPEKMEEYRALQMADYNEAIRIDPKYAPAYFNRGVQFRSKKDYDRALADLNEAVKLGPIDRIQGIDSASRKANAQSADHFHQRGLVYSLKGDIDRAIADYTVAIKFLPTMSGALYDRALAYRTKGDTTRANADFDEAIKLDPNLKRP
jgi:tetratricopeptide (TPR) repeat protein